MSLLGVTFGSLKLAKDRLLNKTFVDTFQTEGAVKFIEMFDKNLDKKLDLDLSESEKNEILYFARCIEYLSKKGRTFMTNEFRTFVNKPLSSKKAAFVIERESNGIGEKIMITQCGVCGWSNLRLIINTDQTGEIIKVKLSHKYKTVNKEATQRVKNTRSNHGLGRGIVSSDPRVYNMHKDKTVIFHQPRAEGTKTVMRFELANVLSK